jgi:predicted nucleic acid-binding protein
VNQIKTFLDSGALIAAARTNDIMAIKAIEILDDSQRQLATSLFVKLEILPKAVYHQQQGEIKFYEAFFTNCSLWADDLPTIIKLAQNLANQFGLGALDALHIASALSINCDEFITTEKPNKPLHRVSGSITLYREGKVNTTPKISS